MANEGVGVLMGMSEAAGVVGWLLKVEVQVSNRFGTACTSKFQPISE